MGEHPYITDVVGRRIKITGEPATTAPLHEWHGDADGHNCQDCPGDSIWKCDEKAHNRRCECEARDDEAMAYHGGDRDGCPRMAAHHEGVITSPGLCLPCLYGCSE